MYNTLCKKSIVLKKIKKFAQNSWQRKIKVYNVFTKHKILCKKKWGETMKNKLKEYREKANLTQEELS